MAQRANLIATYNANPTLQKQYTLPQYLALFNFGQTPTTSTTSTPTTSTSTTSTPVTSGISNIINQNINQGGGGDGGARGGGAFGDLDMSTAKEFNIDGRTVTGYKNLNTGLYQDINQQNIQNLGLRNLPGITGLLDKVLGKGEDPDYPGLFDKVSFSALMKNPGLYKSFFDRQDVAKQRRIQDAIDEANRQAAIKAKIEAGIAAGKSLSQIGRENFTGEGQAFQAGRTDQGGGFTGGNVQDTGGVPGGKYGSPRKDGGLMYAEGGLVTMFKEKR